MPLFLHFERPARKLFLVDALLLFDQLTTRSHTSSHFALCSLLRASQAARNHHVASVEEVREMLTPAPKPISNPSAVGVGGVVALGIATAKQQHSTKLVRLNISQVRPRRCRRSPSGGEV